ncbi:MAG: DNA repair protein RadA, partial [Lachnospiraceae bacterium]|nr:DNA repair protein RadA [Lachnospiraceae bacterium]
GMKVTEPAMDLSIVMAIASGYYDLPIDKETIAFGEVGLTGELRGVSQCFHRVKEAYKLGYRRIIIPFANARVIERDYRQYCMPVHSIREAIKLLRHDRS